MTPPFRPDNQDAAPTRPHAPRTARRPAPSNLPTLDRHGRVSTPTPSALFSTPTHNPLQDFRQAPKKGTSLWHGLGLIIFFPFRLIAFLTRNLPSLILWPLRLLISLGFVGFVFLIILSLIYGVKAQRYDISQIARMPQRSVVLDRKGTEIGTLHGENRREIKNLHAEVPQYFIEALILQEDRRFRTHLGIDPKAVLRAVAQVFKHGRTTQGGSTLTMQLAKNSFNHRKRTMDAKLTEVALARRIESTYDKDFILKCYINRIFWGHTFLGLKQAANGYFAKQPRDLSLSECAMLAGIICNPNAFSPHRNLAAATTQRNKVLGLMLRFGAITQNEYELAMAEPLIPKWPEGYGSDNYAQDLVRTEVDHILQLLDKQERSLRDEILYSGGLRVQTSLDLDLQNAIMAAIDNNLSERLEKLRGYPHQTRAQYQAALARMTPEQQAKTYPKYVQGACVMLHQSTGAVLAAVGGRNGHESRLNRAVQSHRQVGSLFKPIVYTTFFERGGSAQSPISDNRITPGEIAKAPRWSPRNADGRYQGTKPAGWGLLKSRNTMSARIGNIAGLDKVIRNAQLAGFRKPTKGTLGPTIYLGTWEASPFEVCTAFSCFANGGMRATPYIIESITTADGQLIWQRDRSQHRVFAQQACAQTTKILEQITKPGGTAGAMQRLGFTEPAGGKTGTTNNYTNAWFCGFTSELTAAVWVGFDQPCKIIDKGYGSTLALPIWVDAMKAAQAAGFPMKAIPYTPAQGTAPARLLCRQSGMLAHAGCVYEGTAYLESMTDPNKRLEYCTQHDLMAEDSASSGDIQAIDPNPSPDADDEIQAIDMGEE
ncbi:MAG: transglycosylase domain-containing protein [Akkermansia sp.]